MTLKQKLDLMNGPIQTAGLSKTKPFVQSAVVTKALANQVTKRCSGAVIL